MGRRQFIGLPLDDQANYHIKSIVKPARTLHAASPHSFIYSDGCCAVTPDHIPVAASFSPACVDKIRINHYFFRSQEEFEDKIKRGRADTNAPELRHHIETFTNQLNAEHAEDLCAQKYLEELKALLKADSAEKIISIPKRTIAQDLPGYLSAFLDMARLGDTARAELILREALTRFPDAPVLIAVRASTLRLKGDLALARAELHRSLALQPTTQALSELAALHAAEGDAELADKLRAYLKFMIDIGNA